MAATLAAAVRSPSGGERLTLRWRVTPAAPCLPRRVGGDVEQCCVGFWPGNATVREPAFFAYTYPKPDGIEAAALRPPSAAWSPKLGEFLLPYEVVRHSPDPRPAILDFAESTFMAGATRQHWDPTLLVPYDAR